MVILLPLFVLAAAVCAPAATFQVVQDGGAGWDRTITLPEFPADSRLLARLRVINRGDPWDRHGRVWLETPTGGVDVVKFVTGFGGTYWNDPVDVTCLGPLLRGAVRFRGQIDNSGWSMDFEIEEVPYVSSPVAMDIWLPPD